MNMMQARRLVNLDETRIKCLKALEWFAPSRQPPYSVSAVQNVEHDICGVLDLSKDELNRVINAHIFKLLQDVELDLDTKIMIMEQSPNS